MQQNLKDKVALVTGASSGIGEATVKVLVKEGARVVAVARRKDRLDQLAKAYGNQILPIEADISQEAQVKKVVDQTIQKWGRIDTLVANAGVMLLSPVRESKTEEWRSMVDINVLGLMYCVYHVLPQMTKQKSGHIVTLSSVAGRTIFPNGAAYCATKYAVRAFSEALRQEICKDNIRVTIIEPGAVKTELAEHVSHAGAKDFLEDFFASMELLNSEDIAGAIAYALQQPAHVDVNEIMIRPTAQAV
jgi:NADP-dependent 3-hydroxy acid dehydrogenase YdfG